MSADCRRPRSQGFSLKKKKNGRVRGKPWVRGWAAVWASCTVVRWDKTLPRIQKHFQVSKTRPSKNPKYSSQNPNEVLDSGTCFVPMSYVTHASGAPLPEPNHHFLNNNNIEKNKSFIVVTSKLYLHNY